MSIPDRGPKPPTGDKVELTQEEAERIFEQIMKKVGEDLGFSINDYLLLEDDPQKHGVMVLFEKVLQRITSFITISKIYSPELVQTPQIAQILCEPKSRIAVCVAFLYHACSHQEVGAAVKRKLVERQELQDPRSVVDLKSVIKDIIDFFGGDGFYDKNVKSITIDNSYRVEIQLWSNSEKKEYQLNW